MDISDEIESGKITLKVLTTNEVNLAILTEDKFNGKVIQPGKSANRVTGEHGFAMSIKIDDGDKSHLFLLDTGGINQTIIENSKQLNIDLGEVEKLVLSHGHFDHFGGLLKVFQQLNEGCEFYLNPKCYLQSYAAVTKSGEEITPQELPNVTKKLQKEGELILSGKFPLLNKNLIYKLANERKIAIIETSEPTILYKGIITSGEIELFDEDELTKGIYIMKSRNEFEKHNFRDETALYINIKDKGLVVITGCGHCGIINTIKHAQKLTGTDKIYAVIGGFHEEWNSDEVIEKKVKFLENLNPEIICGMHCTGFNFNVKMSRHEAHTLGIVGTEFHL
jgi:7,8-dihydropterin-6-yl-methyl-4-(beta-D-ribofuranosyl)aminobenzene 5'-phosphate synthase